MFLKRLMATRKCPGQFCSCVEKKTVVCTINLLIPKKTLWSESQINDALKANIGIWQKRNAHLTLSNSLWDNKTDNSEKSLGNKGMERTCVEVQQGSLTPQSQFHTAMGLRPGSKSSSHLGLSHGNRVRPLWSPMSLDMVCGCAHFHVYIYNM